VRKCNRRVSESEKSWENSEIYLLQ
jgi:hypothetical protein